MCVTLIFSLTCCSSSPIESPSTGSDITTEEKIEKIIVHYIDVGQGDCIFIELPNQKSLLIDAGNSQNYIDIISYIKDLGYFFIDYVVATHPHADHIGSMNKILRNFIVNEFYLPEYIPNTKTFATMFNTIKQQEIMVRWSQAGTTIIENEDLSIKILSPIKNNYSNINNYSLIIKIDYGDSEFLFTGDAEALVEQELLDYNIDIDSDVLKVGHHGSNSSSSEAFIEEVSPNIAVISCGNNNKYNHPHIETINTLTEQNVEIYRTDELGTIIIEADEKENFVVVADY